MQICFLQHEEVRTFHVDDLLPFEIAEQTGHSFAGRADHLSDLFVRQKDLQTRSLWCFVAVAIAPVDQQLGQSLAGALGEPQRSDLSLRRLVFLAELPGSVQTRFGILTKELEKILALHKVYLCGLNRLRRYFVRLVENAGARTEKLALLCDLDDQSLTLACR